MNEYLTTKELAALLRIKERKVYDLASSGAVPCSRATGKLLFPRKAVESWIRQNASGEPPAKMARSNILLGSHDPLLEWAIRESRCGLASYFDSSLDGLNRFANGEGIASGLHVYAISGDWNRGVIEERFAEQPVVLVSWAKRQRGLIVQAPRQSDFHQLEDLKNERVVPRQPEAGAQVLLEALLQQQSIKPNEINWTDAARSEVDALLTVQEGKADASFGLASLAAQYNLGFVPIIEEQFDILVDRRAWFEPAWQNLMHFCASPAFKKRAGELDGYQINNLFQVRFNGE